jgi:HK97 family phage prohead protease
MLHKYYPGSISTDSALSPFQFWCDASVQIADREKDVIETDGIDLTAFRKNPVMHWNHLKDEVIGRWPQVYAMPGKLRAMGEFAPAGISALADKTRALLKSGSVNAISIGFIPLEGERLKDGGTRYTRVELCEISVVAVPANAAALVTQRSLNKSGRVLSGTNATKLQQAHDAAESCRALVADVLDGAGGDTDEAKAKRLRDIDIINVNTPPPMTRAERMAVAREIEIWSLRNAP